MPDAALYARYSTDDQAPSGCARASFSRTVADTVVFMDRGEIVEGGLPKEFFANPKSDRTKLFLSQIFAH